MLHAFSDQHFFMWVDRRLVRFYCRLLPVYQIYCFTTPAWGHSVDRMNPSKDDNSWHLVRCILQISLFQVHFISNGLKEQIDFPVSCSWNSQTSLRKKYATLDKNKMLSKPVFFSLLLCGQQHNPQQIDWFYLFILMKNRREIIYFSAILHINKHKKILLISTTQHVIITGRNRLKQKTLDCKLAVSGVSVIHWMRLCCVCALKHPGSVSAVQKEPHLQNRSVRGGKASYRPWSMKSHLWSRGRALHPAAMAQVRLG